jgi:hypothetical protein
MWGAKLWVVPDRRKAAWRPAQLGGDEAEHVVPGAHTVAWSGGPRSSQNAGWRWLQAGTVQAGQPG